jgi:hypothetical protein
MSFYAVILHPLPVGIQRIDNGARRHAEIAGRLDGVENRRFEGGEGYADADIEERLRAGWAGFRPSLWV